MELSGVHLLLTYECNYECDHCFVWGSPWQSGTMTLAQIREILQQAAELGTAKSIYFEGGEPLLYYPVLLRSVQEAVNLGFRVGIVSNAFWATGFEDALEWIKPLTGLIQELSISSDRYHSDSVLSYKEENARRAADELGIPVGVLRIAQPIAPDAIPAVGQLPLGESAVLYRGRAAEKLIDQAAPRPWIEYTECPYEDLREPGRVHLDPLGFVHICQGISLGNVFQESLAEICQTYDPQAHPITGPLLDGGPAELVRRYGLDHEELYADACHLCYESRMALRGQFAEILTPDQMYGVVDS